MNPIVWHDEDDDNLLIKIRPGKWARVCYYNGGPSDGHSFIWFDNIGLSHNGKPIEYNSKYLERFNIYTRNNGYGGVYVPIIRHIYNELGLPYKCTYQEHRVLQVEYIQQVIDYQISAKRVKRANK